MKQGQVTVVHQTSRVLPHAPLGALGDNHPRAQVAGGLLPPFLPQQHVLAPGAGPARAGVRVRAGGDARQGRGGRGPERGPPSGRHPGGAPRRLGAFLPAQRQETPRGRRAGASSRQVGGRQWLGGRKPGGGRAGTQDAGPGERREREEGW